MIKMIFSLKKNIRKNHNLMKILNNTLIDLPAPMNISNMWNFGSMLGVLFFYQLFTGLFLASHYSSNILCAFNSILHIMNDVNFGWFFRISHLNGASFFFVFLYLHVGRGLYYNSFNLKETWNLGVLIIFLSMAVAFVGYVLPWGQMSYWGATVITNLISALPMIGLFIVEWVWGGFSVSGATLSRFFMIHFLLPFLLMGLIILHIFFLHGSGSNNPLGTKTSYNLISFHWYFVSKDSNFFILVFFILFLFIFQFPFYLGDAENFILANPLVTPPHIVPEWYFLFAYAILRSIPDKLLGVCALVFSIFILFFPPLFKKTKKSSSFMPKTQLWFFGFVSVVFLLTWIGGQVVESPFIIIGQLLVIFYFLFFFSFLVF